MLPELMRAERALVEEVRAHNHGVAIRRIQGADWSAPENQYRNAITEVLAKNDAIPVK